MFALLAPSGDCEDGWATCTPDVKLARQSGAGVSLVIAPLTKGTVSRICRAGSWSNAGVPWQHVEDSREHSAAATEPALLLLLTRAAETGPRTSWSHQSFATIMEQNNTLSVIMFMAMFGGSTFLLFLLCYCCQRKMRENAFAPLDNATMAHHPQVSTNLAPQTTQIMPSGPPPNYDAVVKKDPADLEPPPYEVAVASLQASGYV